MRLIWKLAAAAGLTACAALMIGAGTGTTPPPQPGYFDIPAGHDFPAKEQTLDAIRASGDVHAQRLHVWNVFAGMTEPTPDGKFAVWETWYSAREAFAPALAPQGLGPRRVIRRFEPPRQTQPQPGVLGAEAAGSELLTEVMFNYPNYKHIRDEGLFKKSRLNELITKGTPDRNIKGNKTIPEFPAESVSLKTIWWPVMKTGATPMPVWDGDLNPVNPDVNPSRTWKRVLAIDPSQSPASPARTAAVTFGGKAIPNAAVVGLYRFHVVQVDAQTAAAAMANPRTAQAINAAFPAGRALQAGDYVVFIGSHLTTKEIKDWVWATFWWHDKPDAGPFAADRPAALKGVWRNYLMSASYDLSKPTEPDGKPHIAFNPWLEAGFPKGITSNCMNCHQRAGWNPQASFLPIFRGAPDLTDAAYKKGAVRTDFLWSVPFESK